jgi:hypothetical protein
MSLLLAPKDRLDDALGTPVEAAKQDFNLAAFGGRESLWLIGFIWSSTHYIADNSKASPQVWRE